MDSRRVVKRAPKDKPTGQAGESRRARSWELGSPLRSEK